MNLSNLFKSQINFWKRVVLAILAVFVLVGGIGISYFWVGNHISTVGFVWKKVASVLPIPVAKVGAESVNMDLVNAAEKLSAVRPMEFAVRQTAITALGKTHLNPLTNSDIQAKKQSLIESWGISEKKFENELKEKDVSQNQFENLFIIPDLYKEKLALSLNTANTEVLEVKNALEADLNFEQLAEKYSHDAATAPLGGDMGFVAKNEVYISIWEQSQNLKDGKVAGPINTPDGFVFVKRAEKQEASADNPERMHLKVILIETVGFENWLEEQINNLSVKIYI